MKESTSYGGQELSRSNEVMRRKPGPEAHRALSRRNKNNTPKPILLTCQTTRRQRQQQKLQNQTGETEILKEKKKKKRKNPHL